MYTRKIEIVEENLHVHNIKHNGFTIIKKFLLKENLGKLKSIANSLYYNSEINIKQKSPLGLQNIIKDDYIVNNVPCLSEEFLNISTTGHHLKILNYFLNDPHYNLIPEDDSNFILAQANLRGGKVALPFHVDVRMVTEGNKSWSYQGFFGLDKINKDAGCLRVVPQSHLLNNMPDSLKDNHKAIDLEIDEGDLIIFSSQLHHATNKTKKNIDPPWSLLLTYRSWWCKQQFDFCKMIDQKIFKKLTPNQKLLLGACSKVPDSLYASPSSRHGYECLN